MTCQSELELTIVESLLHDPASYSGYEAKWYHLLRHLSVSYSLVILFLRELSPNAFPNPPPLPFDDDNGMLYQQPLSSFNPQGRRFPESAPATPVKPGFQDRLLEIVMPEPLASAPDRSQDSRPFNPASAPNPHRMRRGSIGSLASASSFFGRKRSNSMASTKTDAPSSSSGYRPGKSSLPPVSYPVARRYNGRTYDMPNSRPRSSMSSRPGSVFSVQSSPVTGLIHSPSGIPPVPSLAHGISAYQLNNRISTSTGSSDAGAGRRSAMNSPIGRYGSPTRRDQSNKVEPAFDKPVPYTPGRVPVLRVFVPLSESVPYWPSAAGTAATVNDLRRCGALQIMRPGDLVVNTACKNPQTTEHVLIYVPSLQERLIPLDYRFNPAGHLPAYLDAFKVPPSYYHPLLNAPQIVYLDLKPYASRGIASLRLAWERSDVTVATGARMVAKRYLHTAGFEITPDDPAAAEWHGMISLEAEGTAEGKADIIKRFGGLSPWEVVRERSMSGLVWLRVVDESRRIQAQPQQ